MAKKVQPNQLDMVLAVLVLATVYVALITIPVSSDHKDVYVDITVKKPLVDNPLTDEDNLEIVSLDVEAMPNTLLSVPKLGSILTSGRVKIVAQTSSVKGQETLGEIYRSFEKGARIVLKKVPIDESMVTVRVYENDKLIQSREVVLE